ERGVLRQQADETFLALTRGMDRLLDLRERDLQRNAQGLAWHSPARRIERGGFELERLTDRLHQAMGTQVESRAMALARLEDRMYRSFGPAAMLALRSELDRAQGALDQAGSRFVRVRLDNLRAMEARLAVLDPAAPLARGYALVRGSAGFVRSRADVAAGDEIRVLVADGEFSAEVLP
ncbi:MAG: exodeoxyribonuclease VII large subunit, partial [Desulfomicrobium sp.]|nr:exodeoxyribonuclease VII large subunit [Desulfomicrobium sp.]